ncbi:MAG TPA: amidohydrolase [Gemmatimonadota bacterium]|nr:amidohydrolase [Gemmatimonadota bacterium]
MRRRDATRRPRAPAAPGRTLAAAAAALAVLAAGACATAGSAGPAAANGPAATAAGADGAAASGAASADREVRDLLYGMPNGAWESTYRPLPSNATLIRGGTVMTAAGRTIEGGDVLLEDGKVAAVGKGLEAPAGAVVVDAAGRYVTPGLIDVHSHMGDYPDPGVQAHSDGNEATSPVTAQVWAEHSVWPQDPSFTRALAGGVTTVEVLPGSANLIGGRGITLKLVPGRTVQDMMFPGAPMALKMACGENPKRVYGSRGRFPSTRMGNVAGYREAFIHAAAYRKKWDAWIEGGREGDPPARDLALETLAEVLRGHLYPQIHCYRADEMVQMINLAREFGFHIRAFHHGVEAYKVRDILARDSIGAALWFDWWGFKMEAFDGIRENLALVSRAGVHAILHTDDDMGVQIMNQNAARAMYAGREAGIDVSRDEALRWITAEPAWALGIDDRVGTLEPGRNADVTVWSGDPFSIYTRADQVFIDGALVYDRTRKELQPTSDFEIGILPGRGSASDEGGER